MIAFAVILASYSFVEAGLLIYGDFTPGERWSGFAALAATLVSVFLAGRVMPRFFPIIATKAVQSLIGVVGGISGATWLVVFVDFILPHREFTLGQLRVACLWVFAPMLLLPAATFFVLDKSERRPTTPADSLGKL